MSAYFCAVNEFEQKVGRGIKRWDATYVELRKYKNDSVQYKEYSNIPFAVYVIKKCGNFKTRFFY